MLYYIAAEYDMKRKFAFFVLIVFALTTYSQVLLREREKIEKQSKLFFKKIDLKIPDFRKVDYYVKNGKYLPAYLSLSEYISKSPVLEEILSHFKEKNSLLIEKFNKYKNSLKIDNYLEVIKKLDINRLKFLLLVLCSLYDDYGNNILFANDAFHQWNIILSVTETVYKTKNTPEESTAILYISSQFKFFKKFRKWQKRVEKNLVKINLDVTVSEEVRFVLENISK